MRVSGRVSATACLLALALLLDPAVGCRAQTTQLEDLLENVQELEGAADLLPDLEFLLSHPVDLNTATVEDLRRIPFLSPSLADSIVSSRVRVGRFTSLSDLVRRGLVDREELERLRPFTRVGRRSAPRPLALRVRYRERSGRGLRPGWYTRLLFQLGGGLNAGWLSERDPREADRFNHAVGFVGVRLRRGTRVVVGDYLLEQGQGLLFAGPYAVTPGASLRPLVRTAPGTMRGYASGSGSWALRGGALETRFGGWTFLGFGSRRRREGRLAWDRLLPVRDLGGAHVAPGGPEERGAVLERLYGASLEGDVRGLAHVGLTVAGQSLESGRNAAHVSRRAVDFRWRRGIPGGLWVGEVVALDRGAAGVVSGLHLARRNFQAVGLAYGVEGPLRPWFRANAFFLPRRGERVRGGLLGATWRLGRAEVTLHTWQGRGSAKDGAPVGRSRRFAQLTVRPKRWFSLVARFREKRFTSRAKELVNHREVERTSERVRREARLQADVRAGRLQLRVRGEAVWLGRLASHPPDGLLLYHQTTWSAGGVRLSLRSSVFDVGVPEAAIYAYEPDVPGSFYVRRFSGSGWQTVLRAVVRTGRLLWAAKAGWIWSRSRGLRRSLNLQLDFAY